MKWWMLNALNSLEDERRRVAAYSKTIERCTRKADRCDRERLTPVARDAFVELGDHSLAAQTFLNVPTATHQCCCCCCSDHAATCMQPLRRSTHRIDVLDGVWQEFPPHSALGGYARSAMSLFFCNTTANALLGMYELQVLTREMAQKLLSGLSDPQPRFGTYLDVGAGTGNVTAAVVRCRSLARLLACLLFLLTCLSIAGVDVPRGVRNRGFVCVRVETQCHGLYVCRIRSLWR